MNVIVIIVDDIPKPIRTVVLSQAKIEPNDVEAVSVALRGALQCIYKLNIVVQNDKIMCDGRAPVILQQLIPFVYICRNVFDVYLHCMFNKAVASENAVAILSTATAAYYVSPALLSGLINDMGSMMCNEALLILKNVLEPHAPEMAQLSPGDDLYSYCDYKFKKHLFINFDLLTGKYAAPTEITMTKVMPVVPSAGGYKNIMLSRLEKLFNNIVKISSRSHSVEVALQSKLPNVADSSAVLVRVCNALAAELRRCSASYDYIRTTLVSEIPKLSSYIVALLSKIGTANDAVRNIFSVIYDQYVDEFSVKLRKQCESIGGMCDIIMFII